MNKFDELIKKAFIPNYKGNTMTEQNQKTEVKEKVLDVQEIIEELSYSWSTPEAQHYHELVRNKKYAQAQKMLAKEDLDKESVDLVMNYFKQQMHGKKKLVEYYPSEYENLTEKDNILVSYGGTMTPTQISNMNDSRGTCFYFSGEGFVPVKKAIQIWKVEIIPE